MVGLEVGRCEDGGREASGLKADILEVGMLRLVALLGPMPSVVPLPSRHLAEPGRRKVEEVHAEAQVEVQVAVEIGRVVSRAPGLQEE